MFEFARVFRNRSDPFAEPQKITVAEAFARHAEIDLLATILGGEPDRETLARCCQKFLYAHGESMDYERPRTTVLEHL